MIVGIGIDLIEIHRFEKICSNHEHMLKMFTPKEIEFIGSDTVKACDNFSVKEAFSKMIGTGIHDYKLTDLEVLRDKYGKPYIKYYNNVNKILENLFIDNVFASISNTDKLSIAVVVGEKNE